LTIGLTNAVQARAGSPFCGVLDALAPPCLTANVKHHYALCMFGLFKKKPEAPAKTGYRAFPETFPHPARARRFTAEEFAAKQKQKMQAAPSVCAGHEGTTIWYVAGTPAERFYIVEIRFSAHPPVYLQSICTFTPTMGMDRIDGELAQDAEELVMQEVLGRQTQRLDAFPASADIPLCRIYDAEHLQSDRDA
jgi:hypothetical protein